MEGLLREAASWIGRKRPLNALEFRHFFGVYPMTLLEISSLPGLRSTARKWLLRTLWWLKEYPTDEEVKNHGAGDTTLRTKRREVMSVLASSLPEVCSPTYTVVLSHHASSLLLIGAHSMQPLSLWLPAAPSSLTPLWCARTCLPCSMVIGRRLANHSTTCTSTALASNRKLLLPLSGVPFLFIVVRILEASTT